MASLYGVKEVFVASDDDHALVKFAEELDLVVSYTSFSRSMLQVPNLIPLAVFHWNVWHRGKGPEATAQGAVAYRIRALWRGCWGTTVI